MSSIGGGDGAEKGAWYQVPTWDGSPLTWRAFRREMKWWVSSLDLQATAKYNLAARWLLRQTGIVRQRGEEFDPDDLRHVPAQMAIDPADGSEVEISPPDCLAGLNKLLNALEQINGQTVLDKRGELRAQFYTELRRAPGERLSEFCTRFRTLSADLAAEGVQINETELGWFLKDKLGLDPLRRQLLETALQGREEYSVIEAESLRLFKDLHAADPLYRKMDRPKLTVRRLFQSQQRSGGSSAASTVSRSPSMFSSATSSTKSSSSNSSAPVRRAYVAEVHDEEPEHAEEVLETVAEEGDAELDGEQNLEAIMQSEAECLATELQEAEEQGVDRQMLEEVETQFEQAAEALVTMKEARSRLQAVRKDRGFGRPGSHGGGKSNEGVPAARKASGRYPCFDCNQHGHWAGDKECQKPGAGLGKKQAAKAKARQVRVAEVFETACTGDLQNGSTPPSSAGASGNGSMVGGQVHEVSMVSHMSLVPLNQALEVSMSRTSHSTLMSSAKALTSDKCFVGALDSACNRTCAGTDWLQGYLSKVHHEAPPNIQSLVLSLEEKENFRFGNGSLVPSTTRWRIPCVVGESVILVWVSIVPIPSLGCLLGRDFLDAIGAILNFADRTLQTTLLGAPGLRLPLRQMAAGHFMLELLPGTWPRLELGRWRKCGLDGVVEMQLPPHSWLKRRLSESPARASPHEHCLTEGSMAIGCKSFSGYVQASSSSVVAQGMTPPVEDTFSLELLQLPERLLAADLPVHDQVHHECHVTDVSTRPCLGATSGRLGQADRSGHQCSRETEAARTESFDHRSVSLAAHDHPFAPKKGLACKVIGVMACVASLFAFLALSLSFDCKSSGLDATGAEHDHQWLFQSATSSLGNPGRSLYFQEFVGVGKVQRPSRLEACFCRGCSVGWFLGSSLYERSRTSSSASCFGGRAAACGKGDFGDRPREYGSKHDWSEGWPPCLEGRFGEVGFVASCGAGCKGHGCHHSAEDQTHGGIAEEQAIPYGKLEFGTSNFADYTAIHDILMVSRDESWSDGAEFEPSGLSRPSSSTQGFERNGTKGADFDGRAGNPLSGNVESSLGSRSAWPTAFSHTGCGSDGGGLKDEPHFEDFKWKGKTKAGVRQMISQAWEQHRRDQKMISASPGKIKEILLASWETEMRDAMNEVFSLEIQLPATLVTEVFTDTEPIARATRRRGLNAGDSLTLGTGWNFLLPEHQEQALKLIERTKPYLVVLAFPCGPWSSLQFLNPNVDPLKLEQMQAEALELVRFAIRVAELQLKGDRHYLMENPKGSMAWKLAVLRDFIERTNALETVIDMCCFNLRAADGGLHRKATRLVTSMQSLVSMMGNRRCSGDHPHTPVMGGKHVTTAAGRYTVEFASAVVEAALQQHDFETDTIFPEVPDVENETFVAEHSVLVGEDVEGEDSDGSFVMGKDEESLAIPAAIRHAVYRLHVNTSHRSNQRLARALLIAGAPKEAVLAAKRLKCDVCAERRSPKARPPAALPPPRDVGQQLHLDLVILEDSLRQSYVVAHATDNVSRYQAAQLLPDKSTASVIQFLSTLWLPLLGRPQCIVADQGREFISAEFGDWCDRQSIFLYHIGVGAPWQNGICERSGSTLKALVGAVVQSHAIASADEMASVIGEATAAYNSDPGEHGVAPIQLVTGKLPTPGGDVLNNFASRLAEHSLIESKPTLTKLMAIRETARLSMIRLHYSRGLRRAELARSRSTTATDRPSPGDLVFFWRAQKYQSKKDAPALSRRRLALRRWHGPGLLVALEGKNGEELSANCFISFRGQLTKCPLEHVRKASSLESVAAGSWEAAIDEVIQAAKSDADRASLVEAPEEDDEPPPEAVNLQPSELVAAMQGHASASSSVPGQFGIDSQSLGQVASSAAPGTPVPSLILQASQVGSRLTSPTGSLQQTLERARALDTTGDEATERGVKRPAEEQLVRPQGEQVSAASADPPQTVAAFEALVMTVEELRTMSENRQIHPLLQLQAMADLDRHEGHVDEEPDHGTWDGRWAMLCENDWNLLQQLGHSLPTGSSRHDALEAQAGDTGAVQSSRKEYIWSKMSPSQKKLWGEAAEKGWKVYLENQAVQVLSMSESNQVRRDLARRKETDRILVPRFVCTDKHDGVRTASNPLPVKASSRLVVPGFRDRSNLEGSLRRDAPTGSRLAQHFLFSIAAFHTFWNVISADVKSAFLKGDPYMNRELYLTSTNPKVSPPLPLQQGQLCRVLKGIFGLADAPREWWLRLSRCLQEHGWSRTLVDGAMWILWGPTSSSSDVRPIEGLIVAHVDDLLLIAGSPIAEKSLAAVGQELGFGSQDMNDFVWCGKRIRRAEDGTVRLSMVEYHENLKEIYLPRHRKSDPTSPLDAHETRQLRAVLGSLQWLVAQLRFDMSFGVSTLQGTNPPRVSTILKANSLVQEFKRTGNFEMVFKPIDYRVGGIVAVSDAALGNVRMDGSTEGTVFEKVYSQACYFILLGDDNLVSGRLGQFNVLDARSHRIARVCRSTYGAETLACEEAFDVGQLCRGFLATLLGRDMLGPKADPSINSVKMTAVVDAKDVHDKGNSDTPSYGSQKSLAFSVSWLRSILRRPNTALKWTATSNMWVDGGTKDMDLQHLRKILSSGTWSISYSPEFVKQVSKAKKVKPSETSACAELPGVRLSADDPMWPHLLKLCEKRGWHSISNMGVQVAFNARSYRTPEPRFSAHELPLRSTFARFNVDDQFVWHQLELGIEYGKLLNQHAMIGSSAPVLITFFHATDCHLSPYELQKKTR